MDNPITGLDDDAMDTSETLTGKRERAPVADVMGLDIPTQSEDKKGRLGDPHVALATEKEVAKEHAQWRQSDMKNKIDTQTRMEPGASFVLDAGGLCHLRGLRKGAIVF